MNSHDDQSHNPSNDPVQNILSQMKELAARPYEEYRGRFHGKGAELFVLMLKNFLLSVITLGIYMAWAKTERRKFFWQNLEFHGQRFQYTGTGKELFIGFAKVFGVYVGFLVLAKIARMVSPILEGAVSLAFGLALSVVVPYAIYGSQRYLMSRTRWRGIRFGMEDAAGAYAKEFILGGLLTVLTLGLYSPILNNKLYGLIINNRRLGNASFRYDGDSRVVFCMFLKNLLLFVPTLGLYWFRYRAHLLRYRAEHTYLDQAHFGIELKGRELLGLGLLNLFAVPLTLGLALPWVAIYNMEFVINRLSLKGQVDFAKIEQRAADGKALGDAVADALDVGLAF